MKPNHDYERFFDAADQMKVADHHRDLEDAWAGGLADTGAPEAANVMPLTKGYDSYQKQLHGLAKKHLPKEFPVYRSMHKDELEGWQAGDTPDNKGWTVYPDVAHAWHKMASHKSPGEHVVVTTNVKPEHIVMRGKREEGEVVLDSGWISGHTLRVHKLGESRADHLIYMVLTEDRMAALHQKWDNTLSTDHDRLYRDRALAVDRVAEIDPTPNKQYTDRLLQHYHKGQFRIEDAPRITAGVTKFHQLKTRIGHEHVAHLGDQAPKNPKDFNSYKSIADLEDAVMNASGEKTKSMAKASDHEIVNSGSKLLHKDDKLEVRRVDNVAAMKVLGRGTRWCTAAENNNMFDYYHGMGELHYIHDKEKNHKYLMHPETDQFMDERDVHVPHKAEELGKKHPTLHKLLHHPAGPFFDEDKVSEHIARHEASRFGTMHAQDVITYAGKVKSPQLLHKLTDIALKSKHWGEDDQWDAMEALTQNQHLGPDTLHMLATKGHVLPQVVEHPNTRSDTLHHAVELATQADDTVKGSHMSSVYSKASRNPRLKPETMHFLYKVAPKESSGGLALNRNTPPELLHQIVLDNSHPSNPSVYPGVPVNRVLKNPNTAGHTLEFANRTWGELTHQEVSEHPNTPDHVLQQIKDHPYVSNRTLQRIADRPDLPREMQAWTKSTSS